MALTVGDIRKVIEGMKDETPVYPDWAPGVEPTDIFPGVEIHGVVSGWDMPNKRDYLSIEVSLYDGDDDDQDDQDDESEVTTPKGA